MTLEYDLDMRIKELLTVLDEYTEWFMQVMRHVTYPASNEKEAVISRPGSYINWAEKMKTDGIEPEVLNRLNHLHDDLSAQADKLANETLKSGRMPEYKQFNKLITLFEEFLHHIRRLERDLLLEDSGLDILTGLRSPTTLEKDIRRELERLSRQGKPFSIALVRIDNFDAIKAAQDEKAVKTYLKLVAEMIKKSMRSFDDAYRLESDEFALVLKQADMSGGVKALERLKKELEQSGATCRIDGREAPLTLSSCIAEPLPGDDVTMLLENLKADLDRSAKTEGSVLAYFEMSPLQRFVKDSKD